MTNNVDTFELLQALVSAGLQRLPGESVERSREYHFPALNVVSGLLVALITALLG